ncbi:MAG: CHASE domain-containing protein [Cucumibacter sp.]
MAIFVLLVPLVVSLFSWNAARQQAEDRRQETFDHLVAESEAALLNRTAAYLQTLKAGAGFIAGSIAVSRPEWRKFVDALGLATSLPGIKGIGVVDLVPASRLEPYAAEQRRLNPSFEIHPAAGGGEHLVVRYAEPEASNRGIVGFDIGSEDSWVEAALLARQTGAAALSDPVGVGAASEFMLLEPLFDPRLPIATQAERQAAALGWLFARFPADGYFGALTNDPGEMTALTVYQGDQPNAGELVYSSLDADRQGTAERRFTVTRQLAFMQKSFTLVWTSTPGFEASVASMLPELILAAGYLFTALFGALLMTFARQADMVRRQVRLKSQQLAAGERRYGDILAKMMDGMVTINERGLIESFNPAAERLFLYRAAEVVGKKASMLLPPPYRETLEGDFRDHKATGKAALIGSRRELEGLRKDGSLFPLELSISEVHHGERRFLCGFIRDITELKRMEQLKSDFVSMVSHELRTPLTSIRGSLGLIAGTQTGALSPRVGQLIDIALSNSERLILLLNDILDLDKVASGRMEFAYTIEDLGKQAEQAAIANRAYAERYRVELKPTQIASLKVRIDAARLMQVMSNLISNAVKHSPEGGTVEISVARANGRARLSVVDHGEGIPEEFRNRIFSRFAQSNTTLTRERGGTGLGLSIALQIVEQLGGGIDFSSSTGNGTTFWVDLPIADEAAAAARVPAPDRRPAVAGLALARVLYVADDGDFSRVLEAALSGSARLVTTTSLRDAEWLLQGEKFAVVVADMTRPGGLGERLINDPQPLLDAAEIPVLVLAAANGLPPLNQEIELVLVRSHVSVREIVRAIAKLIEPEAGESKWAS